MPSDQGNLTTVFADTPTLRALGAFDAGAIPSVEQTNLGDPPRIGFNAAFPFDFDPSNGIDANKIDFDATATHEIGHALGFNSYVGERELSPTATLGLTLLDFFRFRPGTTLGTFPTAQRILASGGTQMFFANAPELGFSTGRSDNTGGDRNQASHWKANELTGVYIGIMDPTAANGERDVITQNDLSAFDAIGYRVHSPQQQLDVAPAVLNFGDAALNAGVERTLTVFNTGNQTLQITGLTIDNARFSLVSPGTTFSLAPNAQQNVVVRLIPTATGAQIATLTLTSNDPNRQTFALTLSGFGGATSVTALTTSPGSSLTTSRSRSAAAIVRSSAIRFSWASSGAQ